MTSPIQFSAVSERFALPLIFAGQAQKEFFINEAFARIDTLLHPSVIGEHSTPPASAEAGDVWIVGENAQAEWAGKDGQLAAHIANQWQFTAPTAGMRIYDESSHQIAVYVDGWIRPQAPPVPATGTMVDAELRNAFTNLIEALKNARIFSGSS